MAEQLISEGQAKKSSVEAHAGCFDFMIKKDAIAAEKTHEDPLMALQVVDAPKQDTHSNSSSEEEGEVEEGGERKKKKKKGLKEEPIKEKILNGDKTACVPIEEEKPETGRVEEKKGFLDKIKEKLPGQHKKGDEESQTTAPAAGEHSPGKEKKGIIDIIKEKLPGQRKTNEHEA